MRLCLTPLAAPAAGLICGLVLAVAAWGMETDQYTGREQPLADSREVLNDRVNAALEDMLDEWGHHRDPVKLTAEIYQRLGGRTIVDRLERWAMKSDQVDKIRVARTDSIYAGISPWAGRSIYLFGLGATIKINGVLLGSDKLGHFFSQGRKFYLRYRRLGVEERAARWSAFTERAIFGRLTTGVFSNADLVANYEGHRFYRSLFEADVVPDKPAILSWNGQRWELQRQFDWADHVNDFWDEARNVNDYARRLRPQMMANLKQFCPVYRNHPERFQLRSDDRLEERYSILGLRDASGLSLGRLCRGEGEKIGARMVGREQGGTPRTGLSGHR